MISVSVILISSNRVSDLMGLLYQSSLSSFELKPFKFYDSPIFLSYNTSISGETLTHGKTAVGISGFG